MKLDKHKTKNNYNSYHFNTIKYTHYYMNSYSSRFL